MLVYESSRKKICHCLVLIFFRCQGILHVTSSKPRTAISQAKNCFKHYTHIPTLYSNSRIACLSRISMRTGNGFARTFIHSSSFCTPTQFEWRMIDFFFSVTFFVSLTDFFTTVLSLCTEIPSFSMYINSTHIHYKDLVCFYTT